MIFRIKGYSHGVTASAIFLSQQVGCVEFSRGVHMVKLQQ